MLEQKTKRGGLLVACLLTAALAVPMSAAADHDDDGLAFAVGLALGSVLDGDGRRIVHPVHVNRGWRPHWDARHRMRVQRWHGHGFDGRRAGRHAAHCRHGMSGRFRRRGSGPAPARATLR